MSYEQIQAIERAILDDDTIDKIVRVTSAFAFESLIDDCGNLLSRGSPAPAIEEDGDGEKRGLESLRIFMRQLEYKVNEVDVMLVT